VQEGDAVHARHLHVQHDHLGPAAGQRGHLVPGEQRVLRRAHDLDAAAREQLGQVLAHDGRVVDQCCAHWRAASCR
jgi:hypothetical protein